MLQTLHLRVDIADLEIVIHHRGAVFDLEVAEEPDPGVLPTHQAGAVQLSTQSGQDRVIPGEQPLEHGFFQWVQALHHRQLSSGRD